MALIRERYISLFLEVINKLFSSEQDANQKIKNIFKEKLDQITKRKKEDARSLYENGKGVDDWVSYWYYQKNKQIKNQVNYALNELQKYNSKTP